MSPPSSDAAGSRTDAVPAPALVPQAARAANARTSENAWNLGGMLTMIENLLGEKRRQRRRRATAWMPRF